MDRLRISGTDEAGRGCVIGPLAIATVVLSRKSARKLRALGAKDSKKLSPRRRGELAPIVKHLSRSFRLTLVAPALIDKYVLRSQKFKTLNKLEAEVIASHLAALRPRRAYLDSPYPDPRVFARMVRSGLPKHMRVQIMSENKADENRIEVSCASILAKVSRDKAIADLNRAFGDFGSGYPSDVRTRAFLQSVTRDSGIAQHLRWSWKTWQRLK